MEEFKNESVKIKGTLLKIAKICRIIFFALSGICLLTGLIMLGFNPGLSVSLLAYGIVLPFVAIMEYYILYGFACIVENTYIAAVGKAANSAQQKSTENNNKNNTEY
jgi:hypothetical protein